MKTALPLDRGSFGLMLCLPWLSGSNCRAVQPERSSITIIHYLASRAEL